MFRGSVFETKNLDAPNTLTDRYSKVIITLKLPYYFDREIAELEDSMSDIGNIFSSMPEKSSSNFRPSCDCLQPIFGSLELLDQYQYLGKCAPIPPLAQHVIIS